MIAEKQAPLLIISFVSEQNATIIKQMFKNMEAHVDIELDENGLWTMYVIGEDIPLKLGQVIETTLGFIGMVDKIRLN